MAGGEGGRAAAPRVPPLSQEPASQPARRRIPAAQLSAARAAPRLRPPSVPRAPSQRLLLAGRSGSPTFRRSPEPRPPEGGQGVWVPALLKGGRLLSCSVPWPQET